MDSSKRVFEYLIAYDLIIGNESYITNATIDVTIQGPITKKRLSVVEENIRSKLRQEKIWKSVMRINITSFSLYAPE